MWSSPDVIRLGAGALDLLATGRQAGLELGSAPLPHDLLVYRVLGARQVVQAVLVAGGEWRALGALVDVAHLASMVPVVVGSRRWRRAALVQIGFAGLLLALTARA